MLDGRREDGLSSDNYEQEYLELAAIVEGYSEELKSIEPSRFRAGIPSVAEGRRLDDMLAGKPAEERFEDFVSLIEGGAPKEPGELRKFLLSVSQSAHIFERYQPTQGELVEYLVEAMNQGERVDRDIVENGNGSLNPTVGDDVDFGYYCRLQNIMTNTGVGLHIEPMTAYFNSEGAQRSYYSNIANMVRELDLECEIAGGAEDGISKLVNAHPKLSKTLDETHAKFLLHTFKVAGVEHPCRECEKLGAELGVLVDNQGDAEKQRATLKSIGSTLFKSSEWFYTQVSRRFIADYQAQLLVTSSKSVIDGLNDLDAVLADEDYDYSDYDTALQSVQKEVDDMSDAFYQTINDLTSRSVRVLRRAQQLNSAAQYDK
ncbi:hypothetical protein AB4254_08165 [Vibrio breoganii]